MMAFFLTPPCPESKGPTPDSKGLTPDSMGRSPDSMGRAEPCPYGVTILHGRCHRHKNNPVGAGFYSAHANNPRLALNPKDRPPNPKDRPPIQWADPGFNGQSRALPLRGEHFAWAMPSTQKQPVGAGFYSAHANNPCLALNPKD